MKKVIAPITASIRDVMQCLNDSAVEICLIMDGEKIAGVMTDGDVRRALLKGASLEDSAAAVMNRHFLTVPQSVGRSEALDYMRARSINQIPIIDADGKLVGLHLLKELLGGQKRENWALIMAGGKGTRLYPLTQNMPKPMIPVAGRPILERIILHLMSYGFKNIYISVNYLKEMIIDYFGDGAKLGCNIRYVEETKPLGSAGALTLLPEKPTLPMIMLNGDLITQADISAMLRFHETGGYCVTIGGKEYFVTIPYGVIEREGDEARQLVEKPTLSRFINSGIYVISPRFFDDLGSAKGEPADMPSLITARMDAGEKIGVFQIEDDWLDIGMPSELKKARGESV